MSPGGTVTPTTPPTGTPAAVASDPAAIAAYEQNFETFRSLNALMWQIPIIAMTLTGGLWFGVSKVEEQPLFRAGLLLLAAAGNLGLVVVLRRLRHIMGCYLDWLQIANPPGFVAAPPAGWFTGDKVVRNVFSAILGLAALISVALLGATMTTKHDAKPDDGGRTRAASWYDEHAERLAGDYEALGARDAHPELFAWIDGKAPMRVLDVGCGTGRDAAALAALGHHVTAVDPSSGMLKVARQLHRGAPIDWLTDELPGLSRVEGRFDLVLLSAVWMHVEQADRAAAMARLADLLTSSGRALVTLRMGAPDPERGLSVTSAEEVREMARRSVLLLTDLGSRPDLLGRAGVSWRTVWLCREVGRPA